MRKVEIKLQEAKDIRKILKTCVCKNKKKHECEFAKLYYHKMTRELSCEFCPVKCLDSKLKEVIGKK